MAVSLFINFNGECKEAVDFYARIFKSKVQGLMMFSQMPADPAYTVAEADKNKVMYCNIPICGMNIMFSDIPSSMELIVGNNISPVISMDNKEELRRLYEELKQGGQVSMELQETFWSELYGMVTDKFGIGWQFSYDAASE